MTYSISDEERQRRAEQMKARHADPAFKEKMREQMKARHADPAFKEKMREQMKARNADPAFKEKMREQMKARHADPAFNPLAALNEQQKKIYRKLRNYGIDKREAIAEALKS